MRTLVYCTAYGHSDYTWRARHRWWLDALQTSALKFDQILLVDDASPCVPDWADLEVVREADVPRAEDLTSQSRLLLYRFEENLGRRDLLDFPGWHRSFAFGAAYARARGFDRVIHLESDAHLTSSRLQRHFNDIHEGWISLWAGKYCMPELAIQVAAGSGLGAFSEFASRPYDDWIGKVHELLPPYSHVEEHFIGDRYGEHLTFVPRGVDYCAQVQQGRESDYYWWVNSTAPTPNTVYERSDCLDAALVIDIGSEETSLGRGWSYGEGAYRWMTGFDSRIEMPALAACPHVMDIDLLPHVHPERSRQRLLILFNDHLVSESQVLRGTRIRCEIPLALIRSEGANMVRLVHPDGFAPSLFSPSQDERELSLCVSRLALRRL